MVAYMFPVWCWIVALLQEDFCQTALSSGRNGKCLQQEGVIGQQLRHYTMGLPGRLQRGQSKHQKVWTQNPQDVHVAGPDLLHTTDVNKCTHTLYDLSTSVP